MKNPIFFFRRLKINHKTWAYAFVLEIGTVVNMRYLASTNAGNLFRHMKILILLHPAWGQNWPSTF
jgi:hypothetical protein